MTTRIGWPSWSLEPLPDWQVTDDPECLTLVLSDEGALQLSSAVKSQDAVSTQEVVDYAESQNDEWGAPTPVECGEFTGIVYRYTHDGDQWNRWFLKSGRTLLFVTYNASPKGQLLEFAAVERMLGTLRSEHAA